MTKAADGDYDTVTFPNGQLGYVPSGYGAQAQAMINQYGGGQGRGGGNGAGTIGTFADGFEAVQNLMAGPDMQRDLDDARALLGKLDNQRDAFALDLDGQTVPPIYGTATRGQRWKIIQALQDQRDYLQERVTEAQIRLNYGSGLAAGGRAIGRALGNGASGGGMPALGDGDNSTMLTVGALGLGALLLRDRNSSSDTSTDPAITRYTGA